MTTDRSAGRYTGDNTGHNNLVDARTANALSTLLRSRRSIRDFRPDPIPQALLDAVLDDARQARSWSNTQPYRIAIASGEIRQRLQDEWTRRFDAGMAARARGWRGLLGLLGQRGVLPDGDFKTDLAYPADLQPARVATGKGLYALLGIGRDDAAARQAQMRRNFECFGAPTVILVFVHAGLHQFAALDAGLYIQSLMLSAHAHGLGTCAQGALATWAGPVREAFDVPEPYKLICGLSIGYASDAVVNQYNPGRSDTAGLRLAPRAGHTAGTHR